MTTEERKKALLEQFGRYLEQAENSDAGEPETVDLSTLLAEMAALKNEVKLASRNARNALDAMKLALPALEADNRTLRDELQRRNNEISRALMLELLDLHDRLTSGFDMLKRYRPVKRLFKRSRERDIRFIGRFGEGQAMTLRRLDQLLQDHRVRPIECVGRPFDPATMNAVAIGREPGLEDGIVLEELRKGFKFENHVLRLAEVRVNKLQPAVGTL